MNTVLIKNVLKRALYVLRATSHLLWEEKHVLQVVFRNGFLKFHTTFHMPGFDKSFIIAIEEKLNKNVACCLFYILKSK
jgi:hypothetical protein